MTSTLRPLLFLATAAALAASACTEAGPVTDTAAEAATVGDCLPRYWASQPAPAYSQWSNTLPAADQGADQIWLFVPTNGQLSTYGLYQINRGQKTVTWAALVPASSRAYALYLTGGRPGTQISIRNPPPPPWPPGDQWTLADRLINIGFRAADAAMHAPY